MRPNNSHILFHFIDYVAEQIKDMFGDPKIWNQADFASKEMLIWGLSCNQTDLTSFKKHLILHYLEKKNTWNMN